MDSNYILFAFKSIFITCKTLYKKTWAFFNDKPSFSKIAMGLGKPTRLVLDQGFSMQKSALILRFSNVEEKYTFEPQRVLD